MAEFDFSFLNPINIRFNEYLNLAQKSINVDSHNTMAKVRGCAEYIINDICNKEGINISTFKDPSNNFDNRINILNTKKIIDRKIYFACHLIRTACNEIVHCMDANSEWAELCIHHMYILSKWYAKKYYGITQSENNNGFDREIEVKEGPVEHRQAQEAYKNMGMEIRDEYDALIFFASANVLNAYVKQDDAQLLMEPKYSFKNNITEKIEYIIKNKIPNIDIYYNGKITYVRTAELQFSYKYLPTTEFMKKYENSNENIPQAWEGIRLQRYAGSLFEWIKIYRNI